MTTTLAPRFAWSLLAGVGALALVAASQGGSLTTSPEPGRYESPTPPPPPIASTWHLQDAAFSSDSKYVMVEYVSAERKPPDFGLFGVWDVSTGTEVTPPIAARDYTLCFLPGDRVKIATGLHASKQVWDLKQRRLVEPYQEDPKTEPFNGRWWGSHPTTDTLWVFREGKTIYLWDVAARRKTAEFPAPDVKVVPEYLVSPDRSLVFLLHGRFEKSPVLQVWDTGKRELRSYDPADWWKFPRAVSPDNRLAVADRFEGPPGSTPRLVLWDVATGKEIRTFDSRLEPHQPKRFWTRRTTNAVFMADGKAVLTADADGGLRRWEVASGRLLAADMIADDGYTPLIVSPSGAWALVCQDPQPCLRRSDIKLALWDTAKGIFARELVVKDEP